jgi:hypothetical protein
MCDAVMIYGPLVKLRQEISFLTKGATAILSAVALFLLQSFSKAAVRFFGPVQRELSL